MNEFQEMSEASSELHAAYLSFVQVTSSVDELSILKTDPAGVNMQDTKLMLKRLAELPSTLGILNKAIRHYRAVYNEFANKDL